MPLLHGLGALSVLSESRSLLHLFDLRAGNIMMTHQQKNALVVAACVAALAGLAEWSRNKRQLKIFARKLTSLIVT
uniref:Uncharacterized protein n=1 Tax=Hyaloperonospora arabidopsidis (strain Emoy2) TaxID=559515 RepID=M4BBW4_HYAAE